MKYNFKKIEPKWQAKWEESKVFEAKDNSDKPKFYGLVEFPYPSGAGMHVGHIKAYSSLEVISRKRRMEGYNVLFPIGFDAFGLPTENYAVKTGTHPRIITDENIKKFSNQLKKVGFSFDWNRVIDTTDEDYYKWTQWIFLKMFEKGLVFRDRTLVNYCPHCKVVLSNEDSQGGKCDICHSEVVQKSKDVWYLRITQYADKLLEGLKDVDYPDNVKQQQIHWIGKSKGAFVNFDIDGIDEKLEIYTTRPDTLFGVTFMVIAPEHPIIDKYKDKVTNMDEITAYRNECAKKTEFERTQLVKDKTGVRIQGLEGVNPVNGKKIPIYIADYVMMGYGTGAIMAVPAHDQRDYDFAKKFGIDIIEVIKGGDISKEAYTGDGEMINSEFLNGYTKKKDSIERMLEELEKKGIGKAGVQYKMKDWAFNRQRYWGEPIPLIHCPNCGVVAVPEEELPLRLPDVKDFEPVVGVHLPGKDYIVEPRADDAAEQAGDDGIEQVVFIDIHFFAGGKTVQHRQQKTDADDDAVPVNGKITDLKRDGIDLHRNSEVWKLNLMRHDCISFRLSFVQRTNDGSRRFVHIKQRLNARVHVFRGDLGEALDVAEQLAVVKVHGHHGVRDDIRAIEAGNICAVKGFRAAAHVFLLDTFAL